jgi:release factor glutamine methyltransferase
MKTVIEVLKLAQSFLHSRRDAEDLLSHVLKMNRLDVYLHHDRPMEEEELAVLRELVKRRASGEPIAYLIGQVSFAGLTLKVDRRVLIPRPETEELVAQVLKRSPQGTLLDLCTGSGCIGLALKRARPELKVILSDLCAEALEVARANSAGFEVEILQGDFLAPLQGRHLDWIVSNPPYVADFAALPPSVRDFEPRLALEGGLLYYERLAKERPPNVKLFLEIGADQGEAVRKIFGTGEILKDSFGRDRFFTLE